MIRGTIIDSALFDPQIYRPASHIDDFDSHLVRDLHQLRHLLFRMEPLRRSKSGVLRWIRLPAGHYSLFRDRTNCASSSPRHA